MKVLMKKLSSLDKSKLPYSLLLDPETNTAAAYTNNHQLIAEQASAALLDFAAHNTAHPAQFDQALHAAGLPRWRPLPAWVTDEVAKRCVLVWLKRPSGEDPDEMWMAIPPR